MQHTDGFAAAVGWIAQLRVRAGSGSGAWIMGGLLFLIALALRLDLESLSPSDPFAVFYLALVLIALACGWRCAAFLAILAGACGWFFFLRAPIAGADIPASPTATILALVSFGLVAAVEIAVAEALARAAALLTGGAGLTHDPRLRALERRARTAARFVADPALRAGDGADNAAAIQTIRSRLSLIERLHEEVLTPRADAAGWTERMEAFCNARIPPDRPLRPLCRIAGDARALDPDRLLALSLAIGDMQHAALAARCAVFDVALRNDGAGGCTLDIRTAGCRAPRCEVPHAAPWPWITQWLANLLDATLTVSTDGDLAARFDFLG